MLTHGCSRPRRTRDSRSDVLAHVEVFQQNMLLQPSLKYHTSFIHHVLPRALGHPRIACRQIRPGHLKLEDRLPEGFILRVEQRKGLGEGGSFQRRRALSNHGRRYIRQKLPATRSHSSALRDAVRYLSPGLRVGLPLGGTVQMHPSRSQDTRTGLTQAARRVTMFTKFTIVSTMPKNSVVSMRMEASQEQRLGRMARRLGRSPSETGALLVEEGLRRSEFAFIDFRDTSAGRQAFIQGTRLSVWMVAKIARLYGNDAERTAAHLERSPLQIQAALNYARAFPTEIEAAIKDNDSYGFAKISNMLPQAERFVAGGPSAKSKK